MTMLEILFLSRFPFLNRANSNFYNFKIISKSIVHFLKKLLLFIVFQWLKKNIWFEVPCVYTTVLLVDKAVARTLGGEGIFIHIFSCAKQSSSGKIPFKRNQSGTTEYIVTPTPNQCSSYGPTCTYLYPSMYVFFYTHIFLFILVWSFFMTWKKIMVLW